MLTFSSKTSLMRNALTDVLEQRFSLLMAQIELHLPQLITMSTSRLTLAEISALQMLHHPTVFLNSLRLVSGILLRILRHTDIAMIIVQIQPIRQVSLSGN